MKTNTDTLQSTISALPDSTTRIYSTSIPTRDGPRFANIVARRVGPKWVWWLVAAVRSDRTTYAVTVRMAHTEGSAGNPDELAIDPDGGGAIVLPDDHEFGGVTGLSGEELGDLIGAKSLFPQYPGHLRLATQAPSTAGQSGPSEMAEDSAPIRAHFPFGAGS